MLKNRPDRLRRLGGIEVHGLTPFGLFRKSTAGDDLGGSRKGLLQQRVDYDEQKRKGRENRANLANETNSQKHEQVEGGEGGGAVKRRTYPERPIPLTCAVRDRNGGCVAHETEQPTESHIQACDQADPTSTTSGIAAEPFASARFVETGNKKGRIGGCSPMAVELRLNRLERLTTDAGQNLAAQYSATAKLVQANLRKRRLTSETKLFAHRSPALSHPKPQTSKTPVPQGLVRSSRWQYPRRSTARR